MIQPSLNYHYRYWKMTPHYPLKFPLPHQVKVLINYQHNKFKTMKLKIWQHFPSALSFKTITSTPFLKRILLVHLPSTITMSPVLSIKPWDQLPTTYSFILYCDRQSPYIGKTTINHQYRHTPQK